MLTERQQQILDYLQQRSEVQIETLADLFSVTTQTIRRDVNVLCQQGLARRVHGGLSLPPTLTNTTYQFRHDVESEVKSLIGKQVASHIPEGSTVMMGIGTSVTYVAQFLVAMKSLRVITNNLQVAKILESNSAIEVYLSGGLVRSEHQDLVGYRVLEFFSDFEADIGIIGCATITPSMLAMEHELQEAEISKAILSHSRQSWLLADASKWERLAAVKVACLSQFDTIYTNKKGLSDSLSTCEV